VQPVPLLTAYHPRAIIPIDRPFSIYREQLYHLHQGHALWNPNTYDQVSIGDVGFVREGQFYRMFNVILPWNDPLNSRFGEPEPYAALSLNTGQFQVRESVLCKGDYSSGFQTKEDNASHVGATGPDEMIGFTYKCSGQGALLHLPHDGLRQDTLHTKAFEDCIRDNVVTWFKWARRRGLDVERMEDLILVTGCTLVTSWAAVVFADHAEIALETHPLGGGRTRINWSKIQGPVVYHNSSPNPNPARNQCVFIRGFRAKRLLFWTRILGA